MVTPTLALTNTAMKRRRFIEGRLGNVGSVLEIGAFDNPTFRREMGDKVKYLDWFSRQELIENHRDNKNRSMERVVEIDFVVKNNRISQAVGEKFDLICANHVIEHLPNIVQWLKELDDLLSEQGFVFLSVPDKRYTFDYYRTTSTATDMLRAYEEGLDRPSKWQLLDHLYYHQSVDLAEIWSGSLPRSFKPRFSLSTAIELAEEKAQSYTDCHCWTFSSETFSRVIADLLSAGVCNLSIEALSPPKPKTNEFHVIMRRNIEAN